jgi:hypothetical protein
MRHVLTGWKTLPLRARMSSIICSRVVTLGPGSISSAMIEDKAGAAASLRRNCAPSTSSSMSCGVASEFGTIRGASWGSIDRIAISPRLVGRHGCALSRNPGKGSGLISARLPVVARVYDNGEK